MGILSKLSPPIFQTVNEFHALLGSGIVGFSLLIQQEFRSNYLLKTLTVLSVTIGSLIYVLQSNQKTKPTKKKIVFITGCDSGLGFSLVQHISELGFTVFAGFLNLESEGAKEIKLLCGDDVHQLELDVTKIKSVTKAVEIVENFIKSNLNCEFYAIINNAGVMVFGEFEWLTERLIHQQTDVNLFGTFRVTKAFMPLLRKYRGRIITITSHCAHEALPGLAVYAATKHGLKAWCDSTRVELAKYGVQVVMLIPGSFFGQSKIMANQAENMKEMYQALTPEQIKFYGNYFSTYNNYLTAVASSSSMSYLQKIVDEKLYSEFEGALLDKSPKWRYKNEPFRYRFYHTIFRISPVVIRDYFMVKFMQVPEYTPDSVVIEIN